MITGTELSGSFVSKKLTIGASPVQLTTETMTNQGVEIKADLGNTGTVFVGLGNVLTSDNCTPIDKGERVRIPVSNPSALWAIGSGAGQVVYVTVYKA